MAAAIRVRRANPASRIMLLEKSDRLLPWIDRKGLIEYPLANLSEAVNPNANRMENWLCHEQSLQKWPSDSVREWFRDQGIQLTELAGGSLVCGNLQVLRDIFKQTLVKCDVDTGFGYSLESMSVQPDGTFRIWSKEGDVHQGNRIILATGGERNHGLKIACDLGAEIEPPVPAFVRLRLASPKMGDEMGPLERHVRVRCLKSGSRADGLMKIFSRGLEGMAISTLSAMQSVLWNRLKYALQIEVDWLPSQTSASILKELISKAERGGKRSIADTPMFSFPGKSWNCLLRSSRIDEETTWSRIKMKKLQAFANRIKADRIAVSGMGLPEIERAWTGGVALQSLNQQNFESLTTPGLHFAGEILDMHGMPGGGHQNLMWATAHVAACATND